MPGTFADRRELDALAGALAEEGVGVFELVPYGGAGEDAGGVVKEFEWMMPLARDINRPFSLALVQNLGYPDAWREALRARRSGGGARRAHRRRRSRCARRRADGLRHRHQAAVALSRRRRSARRCRATAAVAQLRDPRGARPPARERRATTRGVILGGMATLDHVFPLDGDGVRAYETTPERSVVALAAQRGVAPLEVMLDLLIAHEGRSFFLVPLFNPDLDAAGRDAAASADHDRPRRLRRAHDADLATPSYTTFALAYWVRERRLMPLERMVHKLTGELAAMWGIADRGVLRRGAFADLNVIDFDRLDLRLPEVRHDLPTGAAHLHRAAIGYAATVVNGQVLMRDGQHTGAYPGPVLRNAWRWRSTRVGECREMTRALIDAGRAT